MRETYFIVGGSSSAQMVAAELGGWERPVSEGLVGQVLKRRRQEEAQRENLRRLREARWREIAAGLRDPLTHAEVFAQTGERHQSSDSPGAAYARERRQAKALDQLTAAVDGVERPSHRQRASSAAPVVTGPGGTRLLSFEEAERRTGIKAGTLRQRAARGSLESVHHEGVRLREVVVEGLAAKAAA